MSNVHEKAGKSISTTALGFLGHDIVPIHQPVE